MGSKGRSASLCAPLNPNVKAQTQMIWMTAVWKFGCQLPACCSCSGTQSSGANIRSMASLKRCIFGSVVPSETRVKGLFGLARPLRSALLDCSTTQRVHQAAHGKRCCPCRIAVSHSPARHRPYGGWRYPPAPTNPAHATGQTAVRQSALAAAVQCGRCCWRAGCRRFPRPGC